VTTERSEQGEEQMRRELRAHGQEHVLRRLDELDGESRQRLLRQLAGLDFARLDRFKLLINTPPTDVSFADVSAAPIERLPLNEVQQEAERRIARIGRQALEADRVAVVTVAGGQGTRLRYDHPKGMYPITPILEKSLFRHFAEQILAGRRRHGCSLPWFVMTSPTNDAETRAFFRRSGFFDLGEGSVHFFVQRVNPIVDRDGRLLMADRDRLLVGPDGHGGTFSALAEAGMLDVLREGGWDLVSYFQVDNPLVTVVDPRFIGHHLNRGADFSCKVVPKRDPEEGLGLAVMKGDRPAVIEYVDVPPEVAAARLPSGKLRLRYGSIAIHVIDVPFAERVAAQAEGLPWHVARKRYEILNERGEVALAPPDSCYKFERFVFDALRFADECAFVEVRRDTEFAPVKNAEGQDSPATARQLMQRRWLQWLQEAGARVSLPNDLSGPVVEISPLYAADAEQLKDRIEPGSEPSFPLVLEP
jgi:UDP-N-acetylglucosamine/UDP-N-acetylgalactosamine diphosphorylase